MRFDEAVDYLLSLGHETLTIKLGLQNTELLLQALNNPERAYPAVQIAGTNGKGSTAVFLDSICRSAGIRTGLYTSPHLQRITERIKVAGLEISQDEFARQTSTLRETSLKLVENGQLSALPTFFEQVTAIALVAFRAANIELAILETGLGGRLDSTTAANAGICAITQIDFDHEEYLGRDLRSIASEKAAIIRPGVDVVVAPQATEAFETIWERCREVGVSPQIDGCKSRVEGVSTGGKFSVTFETNSGKYANVSLGLRGQHQIENAAISIQLAELLRARGFEIDQRSIVAGLEDATHPGRLEWIDRIPTYILDGAHNPAGARALRRFLDEYAPRPLTIVFGAMQDKNLRDMGEVLFPLPDELIFTPVKNPRTASTTNLTEVAAEFALSRVTVAPTSEAALEMAAERTSSEGTICITGSLYLIGEVRQYLVPENDNTTERSA